MATRATSTTVWATPGGSASMAALAIWSTAVGPATPTAVWAAPGGSAAVGPAAPLLCPTTATTSMGNAAAIPINGHAKRLVNYTPPVYLRGSLWRSSFLYRPYRDWFDSTVHSGWLRCLVDYRPDYDRDEQL